MDNKLKESQYTDFKTVSSVMSNVIKDFRLEENMRRATLFKFWPQIVGKKFEKKSFPVSFNQLNNTLVVSCTSSAIAQELFFFKAEILKKIQPYAKGVGFEITDIIFNKKSSFTNLEDNNEETKEVYHTKPFGSDNKYISDKQLEAIFISDDELKNIKSSIYRNKFASIEQKERLFNVIKKDLKRQKYKILNNYPTCKKCGIVIERGQEYCTSCKYNN